ncbi:hypothetical protein A2382_03380 [Candidatus Woesebacteria bacterium RIFOXYB1_FULL_38_16]|uniref:3-keto-disaccharide hydrolase domain-containing protein n=1 Tax=Candidatus Woesebacteria bacterium RIFOXYB1_FULL_38_16 TaxID=1802538 RepID=A0A1F8CSV5_9BACT|nr:MAG: hypothetical protein A2191_02900 [Candidatus Woesebacteria bacterium RIFOXYA1_FULL_38_9]OGM78909.1 MAG: hypothetical protein A2382_03380 [Candidatus Woesebacteria bacterium RIFOXYB1_FULL_38_16]
MADISQFINFKDRRQLATDVLFWLISALLVIILVKVMSLSTFSFKVYFPDTIIVALYFLVIIYIFVLLKDFREWVIIFCNRDKTFSFRIGDWPGLWIFNGGCEFGPEKLVINSSRSGCLLENYYWKDFTMSFDVKFEENDIQKQKLFGIIFRAKDFDNYFMLEIGIRPEKYSDSNGNESVIEGIKPHLRYKGGWEELAIKKIDKFDFGKNKSFQRIKLRVIGNRVDLFYQGGNVFSWRLPTHVDVNHFESGVIEGRTNGLDLLASQCVSSYGLVGFRSHWNHAPAIIKNLIIKPMKSF